MKKLSVLILGILISCFAHAQIQTRYGFPAFTSLPLTMSLDSAISPMTWVSTPLLSITSNRNNYAQVTNQNLSAGSSASSDFIAYSNLDSTDSQGYMDMGIESSGFAQAPYAVTAANEGYIFMSAPNTGTGNMILATDSTGSANNIIFATNGLASLLNRRMWIFGSGRVSINNSSDNGIDQLQVAGSFSHTQSEKDQSLVVSVPTTGQTLTITINLETLIANPAGTLAALTVTLPTCSVSYNGQIARFSSTQIITTLTVNATAGTVSNAPVTEAAGQGFGFICYGTSTTWFRLY